MGLFYQLYFNNIGQEEVCVFLRDLLRHLRGPVIAILDNSQTHHGQPLSELQRRHPRLHIEHFPSYAPELNPDEGVWSLLAKRDLANSCPHDVEELMEDLIRSIEKIRKIAPEASRLHQAVGASPFFALYCIIYAYCYKARARQLRDLFGRANQSI